MKRHRLVQMRRSGVTLMELLLTTSLLAIFSVFIMEFLTSAWMVNEKDLSRARCVVMAENVLEMAGGVFETDSTLEIPQVFYRVLTLGVTPAPDPLTYDVATWSLISRDSPLHTDGIGHYYARVATDASIGQVSSFTLWVGDAYLANLVEVDTALSSRATRLNFGIGPVTAAP